MRDFAKIADVQAGDILEADSSFNCIQAGAILAVWRDSEGLLYVKCDDGDEGRHYLDGQVQGDHYVGFYKV